MEPPGADNVDFSEIYAMDRIGYNMRQINFCRVFVAIVSGMASGILGLTGILGFLAFFGSTLLLSVGLYLSVGCNPRPYFKNPNDIWSEGISQAGMSYVLFWTLRSCSLSPSRSRPLSRRVPHRSSISTEVNLAPTPGFAFVRLSRVLLQATSTGHFER